MQYYHVAFLLRVSIYEINNVKKPCLNVTQARSQGNRKPTPFDILSEQIEICPGFSWAWVQGTILDHRRSPGSQLYTLPHHHKRALVQRAVKSREMVYWEISHLLSDPTEMWFLTI